MQPLKLADSDRNIDLYHWSSGQFSSTWYDTLSILVAKGQSMLAGTGSPFWYSQVCVLEYTMHAASPRARPSCMLCAYRELTYPRAARPYSRMGTWSRAWLCGLVLWIPPMLLAAGPLPALNIDPDKITISGISSGADFVVGLHVAHSSVIKGVGVFAGQAYHCAVTRFPKDPMLKNPTGLNSSVPVCEGCPAGDTLEYDHCKNNPEYVDVDLLVEYARTQSALGNIDNTSNIAGHQLYFYRGTHDTCYKTGAEEATLSFYSRLTLDRGDDNHVSYEGSVGSNHAQPTLEYGADCGGKPDAKFSYIENCGCKSLAPGLQPLPAAHSHSCLHGRRCVVCVARTSRRRCRWSLDTHVRAESHQATHNERQRIQP